MKLRLNKAFLVIFFVISILSFGLAFFLNHMIHLNGEKTVVIALNDEYQEEGASINFFDDEIVKITGEVDNTKVGKYKIKYETNFLGIKVSTYRTVKVIDEIAPIITLVGEDEVNVCPNGKYVEEGYSATDNYDGDITSKVIVKEDDDAVSYSVNDSSNNSFTINRHLKRVDNETPNIKLKGTTTYYVVVGDKFVDPGYEVTDNCDSSVSVKVSGEVNVNKIGTYEITYTAVDASDNSISIKRYVRVRDKNTSTNTGVIYLTFDDGPSSNSTPKILDILDKKGVKATFFVINHSSSLDYLIKKEYDSGHTVALHSYSHNYGKIYSSKENYYSDLKLISDKVERITGEKSMIIRFPGGSSNTISKRYKVGIMTDLTKEVIDMGYHYFDWNISSGDAGGAKNSDDVYKNVVNNLRKNKDNIVLMHDFSNSKSVAVLEDIIDYGLANGYRFDKIDMTTPMIRHGVNN